MLATICFYTIIGLFGLFGLALVVVSIASLVHNLRRSHRVKKYTNEQSVAKNTAKTQSEEKQHTQENTQYIVNNGRPVIITQSGYDNHKVTIGYVPNSSTLRVVQKVQANAGNSAEKKHKPIKNKTKTSKVQRNNNYNTKQNKNIPKTKLKNKNVKSNYNSRFTQHTYRRNNFT